MTSRSRSRSCSRSSWRSSRTGSRSGWSRSAPRSPCTSRASSTCTQALAGFGDPAVIFIATLFVVSEGLDATGVTTWAGQALIARVGESRTRLHRADDAAGRRTDRADQRERRGRRPAAGRRRDRGPPRALAVAAADAARLRRPRRFHARADRHAGERHRERGRGRRPAAARSGSSSSASSASRSSSAPSPSSCSSASDCSRHGPPAACRRTSAATPGRSSSSTGWTTRPSRS